MLLKKLMIFALAAFFSLTLGSCFFLPEEARMPELPVVTPYDGSDFRTTGVKRGDMELKKTIQCTYQATNEMRYSFPVSGERYGDIYVEAGDRVSAGTLLAEMDVSDINSRIEACVYSIREYEIRLSEAEKAYELAILSENLTGSGSSMSPETLIDYLTQSLEIQKSKLDELNEKKRDRQLYADIDGVVTYVKAVSESSTTIRGEKIITVTDDSSSVFIADTESYRSFPIGFEVDILSDGVTYRCQVISPPEHEYKTGVSTQETGSKKVYFTILDALTPEKSNARGEITLIEDVSINALLVSSAAVFEADGKTMVYVLDEDGTISAREIETGLRSMGYTEIISGLNEGEKVIIG